MPALTSSLAHVVRSLADFLFPPICFGCDEETESGLICDSCRLLLFTSELDVCPRCGRPCADASRSCGWCDIPCCLSRTRSVGLYQPPFSKLIHALKYREKTVLAELMGDALAALIGQDSELRKADVLCPIPLHPARLRERGYNQSELLARRASEQTGIPVLELLVRKENTPSQTTKKNSRARLENLHDAFGVGPGISVAGGRIMLVDDVITSGATLDAAGQQLLRAGATSVLGLVVAAAGSPDGS